MNIYTVTEARTKLFKLVDEVNRTHEPVYIKSKSGDGVILSREDYESWQETLYLYSINGLTKSILEASEEPLEKCVEHSKVRW